MRLSLLLIAVVPLAWPGAAQPSSAPSWTVRYPTLKPFLQSLAPDEQSEQLKDWALFGLLSHLKASPGRAAEAFRARTPMRYPYLRDKAAAAVGPGRIAFLGPRECAVLLPLDSAQDAGAVGSLLDQERLHGRPIPEKARIFGYAVDEASSELRVSELRAVSGRDIFSGAFGYKEAKIDSREDLEGFLAAVSDVVMVRWQGKGLVLGGRAYPRGTSGSLTLADAAALYQAYNAKPGAQDELKSRSDYAALIERDYQALVSRDARLRRALRERRVSRARVLAEIRRRVPYRGLQDEDPRVGFSLDPGWDYPGLSQELLALAKKAGRFQGVPGDAELSAAVDSEAAELASLAEAVGRRRELAPLLRLERRLEEAPAPPGRKLAAVLKGLELQHSFQTARYDGRIRGTSPGDILFYTDLSAKLWALDYQGLAPKGKVPGFRTIEEIQVPRLYWPDFIRLSKTRLWFGLRQESFDVLGDALFFEPVGTRVYAASSDPMYPGKESPPNYSSAEFLGWWDRHYAAVADYEPYYHKLNQIQKWGVIFMLLKVRKSPALDFLAAVPVDSGQEFAAWYKGHAPGLRSRIDIPFLDKSKCRTDVECLPLLYSRTYPLMGRGFFLSGGVSLASRQDVAAKLKRARPAGKAAAAKVRTAPEPRRKDAAPPSDRLTLSTSEHRLQYGTLAAVRGGEAVDLTWRKGPAAVCNEYLQALVAAQEQKRPGYKDEGLFKTTPGAARVIRLAPWDSYLIKHQELASGWIYLKLNSPERAADYAARASGAAPDSDIFYARLVSDREAAALAGGRAPTIWAQ